MRLISKTLFVPLRTSGKGAKGPAEIAQALQRSPFLDRTFQIG